MNMNTDMFFDTLFGGNNKDAILKKARKTAEEESIKLIKEKADTALLHTIIQILCNKNIIEKDYKSFIRDVEICIIDNLKEFTQKADLKEYSELYNIDIKTIQLEVYDEIKNRLIKDGELHEK